jgi:hypothetical protein
MQTQRADPKHRVAALIAVVTALVLGVVLWVVLQRWFAELAQLPAADAQTQLLTAFALAFGCLFIAVTFLAASLWRSGTGVRRAAQWPLPGSRVVRDTPVLVGDPAIARGRLMQVIGIVLFLCVACAAVIAWRLYHALAGAV